MERLVDWIADMVLIIAISNITFFAILAIGIYKIGKDIESLEKRIKKCHQD